MTAIERLAKAADGWSDRLNPIVVKEVRQGLRTRAFVVSFLLLLGACVLVSLVAGAVALDKDQRSLGAGVFVAFLACFGFVGMFVLPLTAHRTFVRERESEAWPVLQLAGLGPRLVLRGKIASALVQGALYASAIAPFLFFSYFLEGIGLLTIVLALLAAFLWQAFIVTLAVSGAAVADTRFGRAGVSGLLGLFIPISTLMLGGSLAAAITQSSVTARPTHLLVALGVGFWVLGSLAALSFEVGASRLSSPSDQYAAGPRVALLVHLVGSALLGVVFVPTGELDEFAVAASVWGSGLVWVFGLFDASGPDGLPRAHRRSPRRRHLFLPGALRGFRTTVLSLLIVLGGASLMAVLGSASSSEWEILLSVPGLALAHLSLVILVCRGFLPDYLAAPSTLRITLAATMLVLFVTAPFTELYELFEEPVIALILGGAVAALTDRVLAHREKEAEARTDAAREGVAS